MNKKTYKQPSLKVIEIDSNDLVCQSPGEPATLSITDEYVDNTKKPDNVSSDIWAKQW